MRIGFSRRLAIVFGLVVPIAETIRRRHQLGDPSVWPFWLDDWAIGGLLLSGAWKTRKDVASGRPLLAAGWGLAAPSLVVAIKGAGLALAILGLVAALAGEKENA